MLNNKKILTIVSPDYDDLELWYPIIRLREAGADVDRVFIYNTVKGVLRNKKAFDEVDIVLRGNDTKLLDNTYVVFDFETTGFNAAGGDSIIEVGAVKLLNGEIIDKFSELIDPKRKLPINWRY